MGNPNNPLGTVVAKKGGIDALLAKLPQDAILVLDETYYEYVTDPDYPESIDYVKGRQKRNRPAHVLKKPTALRACGLATASRKMRSSQR